jgi:hypothetical protein
MPNKTETKTITCTKYELQENAEKGDSLSIGYNTGSGWLNYYVNASHKELFGYFGKGKTVDIEYEPKISANGKEYGVIVGVSSAANAAPKVSGGGYVEEPGKQRSIELQTTLNAWSRVMAGKDIEASMFAADVRRIHEDVFPDPLQAFKDKAKEDLGATDDDTPF